MLSCGQPNIYHQGFRCKVTGATSMAPVAVAKPPVWCEGDASKCTKGAKQMIYWNQLDGNNVHVSGYDFSGNPKSPAYSQKLGFFDGRRSEHKLKRLLLTRCTVSRCSERHLRSTLTGLPN
ncbi:hypothetical protein C0989_007782 [Termitomyces sp. Mn162]|nr:hypothetical protein C0989_007782 [Termitomyces sp. Mn162]